MCGRISTADLSGETLQDHFGLDQVAAFRQSYNIAPSAPVPVVRQLKETRSLELLHWGLIPHWAKDREIARHTFNARIETVAEKPSFRQAIRSKRCILPVSGFYEWQKQGAVKQPYFIHRPGAAPLALAGLWDRWCDTASGELVESCSIVTMPAKGAMKSLHHRMPAMLEPEHYDVWLDPEFRETHILQDLLESTAAELELYAVSGYVSNARHDGVQCVEPLESRISSD